MSQKDPGGCFTTVAVPHPWYPSITDVACGYLDKLKDPDCVGCHRCRDDWPDQQIALGRAAGTLRPEELSTGP